MLVETGKQRGAVVETGKQREAVVETGQQAAYQGPFFTWVNTAS